MFKILSSEISADFDISYMDHKGTSFIQGACGKIFLMPRYQSKLSVSGWKITSNRFVNKEHLLNVLLNTALRNNLSIL